MTDVTLYFSPQYRISGFGISGAPALANYNGKLYMAWRGAGDGSDKIYYASFDGVSWSQQNRAGGFGISGSPALAVYNDRLYMAWRGAGDGSDKIYYAYFDGSSWSGQNRAASYGISGSPALAAYSSRLWMAWRGAGSGDDKIYYAPFDGANWGSQNRAGSFGISGDPALCAYGSFLYMAWRGAGGGDDKIYYAPFNGSAWGGQNRAGSFGISGTPALCEFNDLLYMEWRGAGSGSSNIYCAAYNGSAWSGQQRVSNFGDSDTPAMAVLGNSLSMAWRGSGSGSDKIWGSFTYTQDITNWMHANYNLIKDKNLKQISLPGAHDAAMYMAQNCSTFGTACNTETQNRTMLGMLSAGVRYFDLRPVIDSGNTMYCGHFSNTTVGIQGCDGDLLQNILNNVKEFLQAGAKELIILKFSHYLDRTTSTFGFTQSQMNALINQVKNTLGSYLFVNNTGNRLAQIPMSSLIANAGTVFAVFDKLPSGSAQSGIYSYADFNPQNPQFNADLVVYDVYSNTNTLDTMVNDQHTKLDNADNHGGDMFLLSWTLTLSATQASSGSTCIDELATQANNALVPNITAWLGNGGITQTLIPNVIYVDDADGWAAATCMQVNTALLS